VPHKDKDVRTLKQIMDMFGDFSLPQAMELRLAKGLKGQLDRLATATGRSGDDVVREALINYFAEDKLYVESAAYHEAGHIVVAAQQGMRLRKRGLRIDQKGAGMAYYESRQPDRSTDAGEEPSRVSAIIAAHAGYAAQREFYGPDCPTAGGCSDRLVMIALEDEMYSDNAQICRLDADLRQRSAEIVRLHWPAIGAIAEQLWAKPWEPQALDERRWSRQLYEKSMEGEELISLLKQFGVSAVLASAAGDMYARP
jgi:predicted transcriptional regulator